MIIHANAIEIACFELDLRFGKYLWIMLFILCLLRCNIIYHSHEWLRHFSLECFLFLWWIDIKYQSNLGTDNFLAVKENFKYRAKLFMSQQLYLVETWVHERKPGSRNSTIKCENGIKYKDEIKESIYQSKNIGNDVQVLLITPINYR